MPSSLRGVEHVHVCIAEQNSVRAEPGLSADRRSFVDSSSYEICAPFALRFGADMIVGSRCARLSRKGIVFGPSGSTFGLSAPQCGPRNDGSQRPVRLAHDVGAGNESPDFSSFIAMLAKVSPNIARGCDGSGLATGSLRIPNGQDCPDCKGTLQRRSGPGFASNARVQASKGGVDEISFRGHWPPRARVPFEAPSAMCGSNSPPRLGLARDLTAARLRRRWLERHSNFELAGAELLE